ncbi:MAG TPA: cytochrome c/FTR1 family iron permease [Gemmatimonadaceae bacterium]|nr:cytochrome c/FTR1 family iron permease [Gemmatimonadaceae bacterium]
MKSGFRLGWLTVTLLTVFSSAATAQENSAKRLSSIVSVAVEEYALAVDRDGKLVSAEEYEETTSFLAAARTIAGRLQGYNGPVAQALLDTMTTAVNAKRPPTEVRLIHARFNGALGAAGALDLPTAPLDAAAGKAHYVRSCASCHGDSGLGDGPNAKDSPLPVPAVGSATLHPGMTPTRAFNVISVGVMGTPMAAFADVLTPQDRWNVISYIYTLRGEKMVLPAAPADATAAPGAVAAHSVLALLDSALDYARAGRTEDAGDRALDAYIAFEPLETPARAKEPGLVATMERHFADFKGSLRGRDLAVAQRARDAIALDLPRIVELTKPVGSGWTAFIQSFLIILREGFEAILVIGAIVAFLIKTGNRERLRSIWIGVGAGLAASAVMAVILQTVFRNLPTSREVIEGATMLLAVVVLFSVSYWLISKVEADKWQKFIKQKVGTALDHGGGKALALVAFLAVFREGAETALFYQALFNEAGAMFPLVLGMVVGGVVLAVIFTLFYRFGIRIPMRPFFTVTSVLLYYMAFVFLGKGIRELQEGDAVGITVLNGMPSVPSMGIFPSMETLVPQAILVLLFIFMLLWTFIPRSTIRGRPADSKA